MVLLNVAVSVGITGHWGLAQVLESLLALSPGGGAGLWKP